MGEAEWRQLAADFGLRPGRNEAVLEGRRGDLELIVTWVGDHTNRGESGETFHPANSRLMARFVPSRRWSSFSVDMLSLRAPHPGIGDEAFDRRFRIAGPLLGMGRPTARTVRATRDFLTEERRRVLLRAPQLDHLSLSVRPKRVMLSAKLEAGQASPEMRKALSWFIEAAETMAAAGATPAGGPGS